ncbi:MAG: GolD/DthD family dehydrogenase, partial [Ruminiclostridium sp.]
MDFKGFETSFELKGKVAMITGAASGIGKAIVELYAEKGADIILVDLLDGVYEVAKSLSKFNVATLPLAVDLTEKKNIEMVVEESIKKFGKIDILVNCAGVVFLDDAENLSEQYWDKTMLINLKVPFLLSQQVGKEMIKKNCGKIINMASQAGIIALDNHVAYTSSKAAIIGMTKVLAIEWAEFNINVNAISPTVILTDLGKKAWAGEVGEVMKKKIPGKRFGYPEEVAAAALYLACGASDLM